MKTPATKKMTLGIKREKWRAKNGQRSKKRRWRRRGYIALPTKRRAINKTAIVFGVRF
ncbi:hypothetical protein HanPSC8_Chr12g0533711 [Helianthus annuus]|nr:hypothetical protein HanPSC8_Chr12g0533711 [Helianthus annuus]